MLFISMGRLFQENILLYYIIIERKLNHFHIKYTYCVLLYEQYITIKCIGNRVKVNIMYMHVLCFPSLAIAISNVRAGSVLIFQWQTKKAETLARVMTRVDSAGMG